MGFTHCTQRHLCQSIKLQVLVLARTVPSTPLSKHIAKKALQKCSHFARFSHSSASPSLRDSPSALLYKLVATLALDPPAHHQLPLLRIGFDCFQPSFAPGRTKVRRAPFFPDCWAICLPILAT